MTKAFNRRSATECVYSTANRGLKPTATVTASLREAASAVPGSRSRCSQEIEWRLYMNRKPGIIPYKGGGSR